MARVHKIQKAAAKLLAHGFRIRIGESAVALGVEELSSFSGPDLPLADVCFFGDNREAKFRNGKPSPDESNTKPHRDAVLWSFEVAKLQKQLLELRLEPLDGLANRIGPGRLHHNHVGGIERRALYTAKDALRRALESADGMTRDPAALQSPQRMASFEFVDTGRCEQRDTCRSNDPDEPLPVNLFRNRDGHGKLMAETAEVVSAKKWTQAGLDERALFRHAERADHVVAFDQPAHKIGAQQPDPFGPP